MLFQESETVELKGIVVEDIKKEVIAFANSAGGTVYVGVTDDGSVVGVDSPDQAIQQVANMVRDSIKPDVTMFVRYEAKQVDGKMILSVEVQRGTDRPYYLAKKGLRPEGVYVRQGTSSVPATDAAIRRMIKDTDGDSFENMRSLEQELTFEATREEFQSRNLPFDQPQMKTLGILNTDGIYTNLGLLLSEQCAHTVKAAVFEGTDQSVFRDRQEFSGSLLKQLNNVYEFIDRRNQVHSTFDKDAPACKDMPTIEGPACAPLQAHQIVIGEHKPYRVCAQRLDQKIPKVDSGRKQYFPARVFHLSFSPKCIVAVC